MVYLALFQSANLFPLASGGLRYAATTGYYLAALQAGFISLVVRDRALAAATRSPRVSRANFVAANLNTNENVIRALPARAQQVLLKSADPLTTSPLR